MTERLPHRRIEFLLCGSPSDAFYSQIAFFRLSLDRLDEAHRAARVVAVFGAPEIGPMPRRWKPYFERIEVVHAPQSLFREQGIFAASDLRYELVDPVAAVSCLCDADTVLLRPLPDEFLEQLWRRPALCGVVAHFPFPIDRDTRAEAGGGLFPGMPQQLAWERLSRLVLGRPVATPLRYTLLEGVAEDHCPFYINYGFLAGPPRMIARLHSALERIQPAVARLLGNDFYGQVSIALGVEEYRLPWRALPMRFNFPNDRIADRLYANELSEIVLLHYLRHERFDRQAIFASEDAFLQFLAMELHGSDRVLQTHVERVTGGRFPFPDSADAKLAAELRRNADC